VAGRRRCGSSGTRAWPRPGPRTSPPARPASARRPRRRARASTPVRAGDRSFVTALLEVAQAEVRRARGALGERPVAAPLPVDGPGVARADEEVEAAEAELRRIEQLRRTTALTRASSPAPRSRRTPTSRPCWPRPCAAGSRA
jgi:hypothetical protein